MATGNSRPTVNPVKGKELPEVLRSLNNALSLIRDEIWQVSVTALNAQAQAGQNTFNGLQGATTLAQLQQQIAALQQLISQLSSNTIDASTVMAFSARHG